MQDELMNKIRATFAVLLSLVALLPIALSSLVWLNNFLYGAVIIVVWWFFVIKHRAIAKALLIPIAALEALPPYPNWLYIDNNGVYYFGFSTQSTSSLVVIAGLFTFYL